MIVPGVKVFIPGGRPFRPKVGKSVTHVEIVILAGLEPVVGLRDRFLQGVAAVVSSDCFVQVPPDAFDRVSGEGDATQSPTNAVLDESFRRSAVFPVPKPGGSTALGACGPK